MADRRPPRGRAPRGAQSRYESSRDAAHPASLPKKRDFEGIIAVSARGTGYLPWEASETLGDIEIPKEKLSPALNGDMVKVRTTGIREGRMQGEVYEVLERAKEEFVGTVGPMQDGVQAVAADDKRVYAPIRLEQSDKELIPGTKVLVKLSGWKDGGPVGYIEEVIGRAGEHRVEMNAIVLEHGFRTEFPVNVAREAQDIEHEHAATIAAEALNRLDFRSTTTFTIDPADAKDFDDALSIRELPDGLYEIGVHIADVTFFVRPGMALEEEARKRATSIYLVDATIPMLPHELSGNVCSLREKEDRLTFSAIFTMDKEGRVKERKFARTIINSDKRFTYEEAQAILDKKDGLFLKELTTLRDLGRKLNAQRKKEGAIEFDQDEVKFVLDDMGKPIKVVRKVRIETNSLIEEFMLLANREVAAYVSKLAEKLPEQKLAFIYRIHDIPKPDRIDELSTYLRAIGYELEKRKGQRLTARDINELFEEIKGTPEEQLIKTATIRSMAKAIYSTKNIGHFGLSFTYYTHFTSPIRRYPDMLVHRAVAQHLSGEPMKREEYATLEKLAIHSSEQEAKAVSAERDSIKYKQVEYLQPKVGQTFDAIVSGVADWGVYVEESESKADGLIRVRSLGGGDYYQYDKKRYAMVGTRTGKRFSLGDKVKVKLLSADLTTRQIEFGLA
jgi:ribonuclease R